MKINNYKPPKCKINNKMLQIINKQVNLAVLSKKFHNKTTDLLAFYDLIIKKIMLCL